MPRPFHTIERSRIRKQYASASAFSIFAVCVAATVAMLFVQERSELSSPSLSSSETGDKARRLAAYPKDVFIKLNPSNGLYDDGPLWAIIFHIVGMSYMVSGISNLLEEWLTHSFSTSVPHPRLSRLRLAALPA